MNDPVETAIYTGIMLPADLRQALEAAAEGEDRSLSSMARVLLREALDARLARESA